ncbi:uncharacterized protein LOC125241660 isoform X2 [Leguminivora glycinivorella]|uniref:uncharacterized protein LOC125241660 isoform X2 n=1 Tax=Leguminivora glycinivorella TaxID=1035111 RepID=UPI00200DE7F8|nr:uncharacterized protein LOC125241660 isoform X2 [Leguminivora glycinivorella]
MDYPTFPCRSSLTTTQIVPKVIKVVNLKRFMPEASLQVPAKSKRSWLQADSKISNTDAHQDKFHQQSCTDKTVTESHLAIDNNGFNQKQGLSNDSKIKFRKCSHSDEELSQLHEHTDDTLVKLGDVFDSRESFKQYLNDHAKRWHYYYVCRNSKKKIIEYNCICMAYNVKEREVVIRKQKKRTTACPCKLRLLINEANKLLVYYVCNHHDHPTTAGEFHSYPHAKYLPQHVKDEFLDLTYLGLDVDLIQKYIHSVVGITIKKKDIWSYSYRFRRKIFSRTISEDRQKYIEGLIAKIRGTYDPPLEAKENEVPTPILETLTAGITLNYSTNLHQALEDTTGNTEVTIQYMNEDGILCDENGIPTTNSSAVMHFINNYAYVENLQGPVFDSQESFDFVPERVENESVETERVLNEDNELDGTESTERNEAVIFESYEKRLSPTPDTPAVYAEMENFKKYYYVDHRYNIPREDQKTKEKSVLRRKRNCHSVTNTTVVREEFIKAPDFVYHPTPIRHCSGHEHLTLLIDADTILPGARFLTHDVFLTYINERAHRWFFYYSLMESGRSPEHYVYKCVYGKIKVSKNAYRAKGLRKRNKLTTQCPCQIRLRRLESDPTYLTVLYSCNHHDHELNSAQFTAQPHSRRLPAVIKEEVKDLITLGVSAETLRKYVFDETGVRVYGKYFHNVRTGMRARGEQRHYSEERIAALTKKIRDLEAIYGNAAKVNIQAQHRKRPNILSQEQQCITPAGQDEYLTQTQEYCELSDRDDFAEEVYIMQTDTLPIEETKQSRLETRLQTLSYQDILDTVIGLQESVRCDVRTVRSDAHATDTADLVNIAIEK